MGKHYHRVEPIVFDPMVSDDQDREMISQLLSASTVFWNFMTENLKEKALTYVNSKGETAEQLFLSEAVRLLNETIRKLSDQEIMDRDSYTEWRGLTYEAYERLFWFIRFGEPMFLRYTDLVNAYQQARENSNSDIKLLKANVPGPKTERSNLCVSFVSNQVEFEQGHRRTIVYVRANPDSTETTSPEIRVFRFAVDVTDISEEHLTGITIKREMSQAQTPVPEYSIVFHYFSEKS